MVRDVESDRMNRVYVLFEAISALPPEERGSALEASDETPSVLCEVAELLELDGSFAAAARPSSPPTGEPGPGDHIGRYEVVERLGEGGMGIVYLAEQKVPVRRRVALKVIRPGLDSRVILARFQAEQQALALMDHPSVARVFDAGATDQGRPYFVMEHVSGVPITEHCRRRDLPVKERLRLFAAVCHAVQHAHQKGVIHRDLKPSNILVAETDEGPLPKVIDFGLAKAIDQPLSERTIATGDGQLLGTPPYMSPEQCAGDWKALDTRSDVYSLGVVLYELLCDRLPYEVAGTSALEAFRIVREGTPARPSTISRTLRGDLETITLTALEKDLSRRYQSAGDLGRDAERFLRDEPIAARPPNVLYRARKAVRRHPATSVAGIAAFVLLISGVAALASLLTARRFGERQEERLALQEVVAGTVLVDVDRTWDKSAAIARVANRILDGDADEKLMRLFTHAMVRCEPHGGLVQSPDDLSCWLVVGARYHGEGWDEPIFARVNATLVDIPGMAAGTDEHAFGPFEIRLGRHAEEAIALPEHPEIGVSLRRPGAHRLTVRYEARLLLKDGTPLSDVLAVQPEFLSVLVLADDAYAESPVRLAERLDATPVDLTDWDTRPTDLETERELWVVDSTGHRVEQLMNNQGACLLSRRAWPSDRFVATIRVRTPDDDDGIGFVFCAPDTPSGLPCYRFSWVGGGRQLLYRVASPSRVLLDVERAGWLPNRTYRFEGRRDVAGTVRVICEDLETGEIVIDTGDITDDDVLPRGRVGFVTESQRNVSFRAWLPNDESR